jgi:hypothetical protein
MAAHFGWTVETWEALVQLVSEAVSDGTVNEMRKAVLLSVVHRTSCETKCPNLFE